MTDPIHRLLERLPSPTDRLFVWLVPAVLLLAAALFATPRLRRMATEWRLRRNLRRLGTDTLRDVLFPDGMDGTVWVEQLSLTPAGIMLLSLKRYPGLIYCAESIDTWTQVINGRSYPFPNPLPSLQGEVVAIQAIVPGTPVGGRVVFTHESEFPKGKPQGVWSLDELLEELRADAREPSAALRQAWARLRDRAQSPVTAGKAPHAPFGGTDDRPAGALSASILVLAATLWLVWWLLIYPG
ncbi:MAG: nuclease-related domain-containing protein [Gammaproteobacteria bacterium]